MRQIKNFMTREKIAEELKQIDRYNHESSAAHLEYEAQKYWDSKEYEICLDYLTRVIDLNPTQWVYFKRSQCFYHLKEWDNALEDLDTCLELDPEYENAIDLKQLILEKIAEKRKYWGYIYG